MCFSIPYQVISVRKSIAEIETGVKVRLSKDMSVKKGDFIRIVGNVAVDYLPQKAGLRIRRLIKSLNQSYDTKFA